MGDSYLSGLPKDSSGREAGSYLQWVETSLSAFSFKEETTEDEKARIKYGQLKKGGEQVQSLAGHRPMKGGQGWQKDCRKRKGGGLNGMHKKKT